MRVLVAGLGTIGGRHLLNLKHIDPAVDVTVWHQRARRGESNESPSFADRVAYSLDEALDPRPDLALITSPASLHIETALALAGAGVDLFIEKPLSHTLEGIDRLQALCRDRGLMVMVGYNLRFYQPFQAMRAAIVDGRIGRVQLIRAEVGQFLPDWRPALDYRQTGSGRHDLGGGALLELSHELDYVRWFGGEVETVTAHLDRVSDLAIDVEDTADIILRFEHGAVGSVHIDMVQRSPLRACRIVGTEGVMTWDRQADHVRVFTAATGTWSNLHPIRSADWNNMHLLELCHFLECVKGRRQPVVTLDDGRRVLEIALAAKRSSQERREVKV